MDLSAVMAAENYAGETDHGNPGAGQRQDRLWRSYHEGYHHDQPEPYLLHDTVYENIVYPLKIRRIKPDKRAVLDMLEHAVMGGKEKQSARSLSSGERQKVSMLRAMCFHPRLVIIDETLSNLDPDSVDFFEKQIRKMNQEEENTWILISHRLSHIGKMCGRIHALDKGKIIQSGRAEEVLFHSPVPEVQRFLKERCFLFPERI